MPYLFVCLVTPDAINRGKSGVPALAAKSGLSEVYERYAAALFALADERQSLEPVADDLRALDKSIDDNVDLQRLVRSPVISREDQAKVMASVVDRMGVSEITRNFVGLLASKKRLFALKGIIRSYLEELARRRGEVTAEVTAARTLSPEQKKAVEDSLRKALGSNVSVEHKIDTALIGGLVVQVGSRMVDSSLRTKLQRLSLAMKGA